MLKKQFLILALPILCGILMLSSCVVRTGEGRTRDMTGLVNHMPLTADVQVQAQKIQGSFQEDKWLFGQLKGLGSDEDAKIAAVANALESTGADVLISPTYTITNTKYFIFGKSKHVRVTGYAGFYKNFRSATIDDKELLEIKPSVMNAVSTKLEQGPAKRRGLFGLLGR